MKRTNKSYLGRNENDIFFGVIIRVRDNFEESLINLSKERIKV